MALARNKAPAKTSGKAKGKSLQNWKQELALLAKEEGDRTPSGAGNQISIKGGKFKYQGADLGDEITVVVLDSVFQNRWYDRQFKEDNPGPPACIALSATGKNMAPFDDSPNKQSETCEDCPLNQWGSDPRGGKGKACGNRRSLAVMIADDNGFDEEGEIAYLGVPVTSTPMFNRYVKKLADGSELPPFAVFTKITFDDSSDYEKLNFSMVDNVDERFLAKLKENRSVARKQLLEKPDFAGYEAPKGNKQAKGGSKRSRLSR